MEGTFEMAKAEKQRMLTIMRKHYTLEDWDNAVGDGLIEICSVYWNW